MSTAAERDQARTQRDRARNTLAKVRGIVVAHSRGIYTDASALRSIASILHVTSTESRTP